MAPPHAGGGGGGGNATRVIRGGRPPQPPGAPPQPPWGNSTDPYDTRRPRPPPPQNPNAKCWFCLGSDSVETHLIASIGKAAYLAMPKGAINDGHVRACVRACMSVSLSDHRP